MMKIISDPSVSSEYKSLCGCGLNLYTYSNERSCPVSVQFRNWQFLHSVWHKSALISSTLWGWWPFSLINDSGTTQNRKWTEGHRQGSSISGSSLKSRELPFSLIKIGTSETIVGCHALMMMILLLPWPRKGKRRRRGCLFYIRGNGQNLQLIVSLWTRNKNGTGRKRRLCFVVICSCCGVW